MLLQYFLSTNLKEGGSDLLSKETNAKNLLKDATVNANQEFNNALKNSMLSNNKNVTNQKDITETSSSYFNLPLMQVDEIELSEDTVRAVSELTRNSPGDFSQLQAGDVIKGDSKVVDDSNGGNTNAQTAESQDGKLLPEQISQTAATEPEIPANMIATEPGENGRNQVDEKAGEATKDSKLTNQPDISSNLAMKTADPKAMSNQVAGSETSTTSQVIASKDQAADLLNSSAQLPKSSQVTESPAASKNGAQQPIISNTINMMMAETADKAATEPKQVTNSQYNTDVLNKEGINQQQAGTDKAATVTSALTSGGKVPVPQVNAAGIIPSTDTDQATSKARPSVISDEVQQQQPRGETKIVAGKQKMTSEVALGALTSVADDAKSDKVKPAEQISLKKKESDIKQPEIALQKKAENVKVETSLNPDRVQLLKQLNPASLGLMSATASTQLYSAARADATQVPITYNVNPDSGLQTRQTTNPQLARDIALPVSMPRPQWNQRFAEHISMLTLKGTSHARIRLDPPELGPMAVRIHTQGGETQIQFTVTNPIARDLVDSGMQRLRDMLEEHGFAKVDVDVNEYQQQKQGTEQNDDDENADLEPGRYANENATSGAKSRPIETYHDSIGIIDIFA
jgi:flagellar hook-length control protein FliK